MPDLLPRWELLLAASEAAERRQRPQPYSFTLRDASAPDVAVEVWVGEGVYSPLDCYTWRFYLPHLPSAAGQSVLEVGCGAGVAALWLARQGAAQVLAVDIFSAAVESVRQSALLNDLPHLEARVSDVFAGLLPDERFDLIFWNAPWGWLPPGFPPQRLSPVTVGNFDVGYQAIGRFLRQGPARLRPGGRLLMTAGARTARWPLLQRLLDEAGLVAHEVARGAPPPPGQPRAAADAEEVCLLDLVPG